MSETKFTPGPWYADAKGYIWRRPLKDLYEYGGGVAGDKPLATVCKGWWGEDTTGYPVEANAHLIAAAPTMYEVLDWLDRRGGLGLEVHAVISTALAQARGEG